MSISNLYEEYAMLEAEIAAREAKKEQLRPHIMRMMIEQGLEKVETSVGKFSVSKRKVWSYPEEIADFMEELKARKAKAESTGEATYEEVDQLRFTMSKL
jgi:hypothetical protein